MCVRTSTLKIIRSNLRASIYPDLLKAIIFLRFKIRFSKHGKIKPMKQAFSLPSIIINFFYHVFLLLNLFFVHLNNTLQNHISARKCLITA